MRRYLFVAAKILSKADQQPLLDSKGRRIPAFHIGLVCSKGRDFHERPTMWK